MKIKSIEIHGRDIVLVEDKNGIIRTERYGYYPYINSWENLQTLRNFLNRYYRELEDYIHDGNNYGISFHVCGYNGAAQNDFRVYWETEGVGVF